MQTLFTTLIRGLLYLILLWRECLAVIGSAGPFLHHIYLHTVIRVVMASFSLVRLFSLPLRRNPTISYQCLGSTLLL
ncbi:hypothetical protein F4824DRAFT_479570 [Ustulina deusta]|nr:hypothetical protein F4824DRAFT_479570 [Ustulina deusta]